MRFPKNIHFYFSFSYNSAMNEVQSISFHSGKLMCTICEQILDNDHYVYFLH